MSDEQIERAAVFTEAEESRAPDAAASQAGGSAPAQASSSRSALAGFMWPAILRSQETYWFALVVIGVLFRGWQILFFEGPMDHIFSDPHRHIDNARHFLEPGPMGCSNPYFYQLFLWVVITLTKEKRILMHLVTAALTMGYPLIWYKLARTVKMRRLHALRFTAVLTYLPTHATIFAYFMNETLILPLVGASVWMSEAAVQRRSVWRFLLAAVLWTCTLLTRSIALPLGGVMLAYSLYRQPSRPRVRRPLLGPAAAGIAGAGLWVAAQHSVRIFEYATPFGDNGTASLYMVSGAKIYETTYMKPKGFRATYSFSSPSFYISPFDPFYNWHSIRKGTFSYTVNVELHGKDVKELWWKQLALHKKMMPRLIFENLIFLAFGHTWPESGKSTVLGKICLQERWIWFPITVSSIVWCLVFMYRRRKLYLVPAFVVFATAALYGAQMVVMEGRYRKPIEPLLLLGLFWLWNFMTTPGVRQALARAKKALRALAAPAKEAAPTT